MPYVDEMRQREAVRSWRKAHPERVKAYKKTSFIRKTTKEGRLPQLRSIEHHALTDEEILQLVEHASTQARCRLQDKLRALGPAAIVLASCVHTPSPSP